MSIIHSCTESMLIMSINFGPPPWDLWYRLQCPCAGEMYIFQAHMYCMAQIDFLKLMTMYVHVLWV